MPKAQINGGEIFYDVKGQGEEVVVLLNGVAMSTDSWIMQTTHFAEKHQVIVHDFRGQGQSTLTPDKFTFEQHAADLKGLLDELQIDKVHVVGVSYGAEVGMYFALQYPECVKTLTLGTAVSESRPLLKGMIESWIEAAKTYQGKLFFKVMAPLVYADSFYLHQKEWLDQRAESFDKIATKEWFEAFICLCENFLTLDVTARLKEIHAPTLIIDGEVDLLKPPYYGKLIHEQIQGSEFIVVKEGGHGLFLEKASEFNELVNQFIQKHK